MFWVFFFFSDGGGGACCLYYWGSIFVGGCLCVMWSREVGLRGE